MEFNLNVIGNLSRVVLIMLQLCVIIRVRLIGRYILITHLCGHSRMLTVFVCEVTLSVNVEVDVVAGM